MLLLLAAEHRPPRRRKILQTKLLLAAGRGTAQAGLRMRERSLLRQVIQLLLLRHQLIRHVIQLLLVRMRQVFRQVIQLLLLTQGEGVKVSRSEAAGTPLVKLKKKIPILWYFCLEHIENGECTYKAYLYLF